VSTAAGKREAETALSTVATAGVTAVTKDTHTASRTVTPKVVDTGRPILTSTAVGTITMTTVGVITAATTVAATGAATREETDATSGGGTEHVVSFLLFSSLFNDQAIKSSARGIYWCESN
jgi:hypothetical protein